MVDDKLVHVLVGTVILYVLVGLVIYWLFGVRID